MTLPLALASRSPLDRVENGARTHMQRREPSKAPMSDRRSLKIGMASAMMNEIAQLTNTQELPSASVDRGCEGNSQPNKVMRGGIP